MKTHLLPVLLVQGETKTAYRKMISAMYDAGIRAFCVESRNHGTFLGDEWWHDMDVILDEAAARGMQVWIFDDKYRPTGYANGGLKNALLSQHRWGIYHTVIPVKEGKTLKIKLDKYLHPADELATGDEKEMRRNAKNDDLVSVSAIGFLPTGQKKIINLSSYILDGVLIWTAPEGEWSVEVCGSSMNTGYQHENINLMNRSSCRILLDQVYEPFYAHYSALFGNTIAGFYSTEASLGNFRENAYNNVLGTEQDLPYSDELEDALTEMLDAGWKARLPLLWRNDYDEAETAYMRYAYMDCVTRLVEEDFSHQIGNWCREHGVGYIGRIREENNQHARTGNGLGHFFRAMKWQSMAGIDDKGGQIYPQSADMTIRSRGVTTDGEFNHFALGKLGASLAALNPNMNGNSICEIFGDYGWSEGARLGKYLVDHFMVRGVNHFMPYAYSCKNYPETERPPYFYAPGDAPDYRHFNQVLDYAQRVCYLISGGAAKTPVAILYQGEAEWTGKCMLMQKPARALYERQVDYLFVPADVFEETEFYGTELGKKLTVNGHEFETLVIPYAQYITRQTAEAVIALREAGCRVIFVDALPEGICNGAEKKLMLPKEVAACPVVKLEELGEELSGLCSAALAPASSDVRILHYEGDWEFFYLFNEGAAPYTGTVTLPEEKAVYVYNAWDDRNEILPANGREIPVALDPSESLIIMIGTAGNCLPSEKSRMDRAKQFGEETRAESLKLRTSTARSYPAFGRPVEIKAVKGIFPNFAASEVFNGAKENGRFSGVLQYEANVDYTEGEVELEVTDANEGMEVFVNGLSLGLQINPPFRYNLTPCLRKGANEVMIEVSTTLENETRANIPPHVEGAPDTSATGILGEVGFYFWKK